MNKDIIRRENNIAKVSRAITSSKNWLENAENKNETSEHGGLTIYGCEKRNLEEYREIHKILMENQGKTGKLKGRLRELFNAI
tara:strand:- start:741 stop:989 length:249 start_codon:yes stop_codon:yes gene_type:complete